MTTHNCAKHGLVDYPDADGNSYCSKCRDEFLRSYLDKPLLPLFMEAFGEKVFKDTDP